MTAPTDTDFRARLAALNAKFAATVPGTMDKLARALAACRADGATPGSAALHDVHELLHGLAGSAGTFGFATLGQEARRIEQQVRVVMKDGSGWDAIPAQIEQLLAWAARDAGASEYN